MANTRSSKHASIDWLAKGPLAPHIDEYIDVSGETGLRSEYVLQLSRRC